MVFTTRNNNNFIGRTKNGFDEFLFLLGNVCAMSFFVENHDIVHTNYFFLVFFFYCNIGGGNRLNYMNSHFHSAHTQSILMALNKKQILMKLYKFCKTMPDSNAELHFIYIESACSLWNSKYAQISHDFSLPYL